MMCCTMSAFGLRGWPPPRRRHRVQFSVDATDAGDSFAFFDATYLIRSTVFIGGFGGG